MSVTSPTELALAQRKNEVRRVVLSSYLGSTIEFYDFLLYATAASLVFAPVFFSGLSPLAGTIASLGTFAAGYLARPFGGVIFGHFGDKYGRKSMLLVSMTIMGLASFLIGAVPSAAAIGSWAAIILIALRLCQGIAVGGEWGGAALMSLEHVGGKGRGFAAAFTNAGAPTGALLGTLALTLAALLPEKDFLSWGWRIPFLLSAVLLVVGIYVRSKISESPVFEELIRRQAETESEDVRRTPPLVSVLRRPKNLLLAMFGCMASFGIQTMFAVFAIGFAANHGVTRPQALLAFAICQFFAIFTLLAWAALSDRIGRRKVMLFGLILFAILATPIFSMLASGNFLLVTIAFVAGFSICQSATYGPMAAYITEQFGTSARYTGASLGYQGASLLGAGLTPVVLASLQAATGGSTRLVTVFMIGMALVSAVFILVAKESKDRDLLTYEH